MRRSRLFRIVLLGLIGLVKRTFVAALVVLAGAAHAQTSRGTVAGTVLDPTGAVIHVPGTDVRSNDSVALIFSWLFPKWIEPLRRLGSRSHKIKR